MICLRLGPPWFNYWFSLARSDLRFSPEYSVYQSDLFEFHVFTMMHRLSLKPLCEPNLYVFLYYE